MKKNTYSLLMELSNEQLVKLTNIVNETIATPAFEFAKEKKFTAADLWNIQRQPKARTQRRYSL